MNTNERPDFYNEVDNDEINAIIDPVTNDDMTDSTEVHLIGGEALGDDAADFAPDALVMDIDSDSVFDFNVADIDNDGLVNDVEILEPDIDTLDDLDYGDAIVMDVESDGDFDFAIADVNNDGFIDSSDVIDTLDNTSSGGYIGYETSVVVEEDPTPDVLPEEPIIDEELPIDEGEHPEVVEETDHLYDHDDNGIDIMSGDLGDII